MKKQVKISGGHEIKGQSNHIQRTRTPEARETDGTSVTATVGLTLSENFQSVRVEASVTLPTFYDAKRRAMEEAWEFVDEEVAAQLKSAKKLMANL